MTELGLGTAQLGLPYGVSNRAGQPSEAEAAAILERALKAGVRTFDTAPAYGESEALVGRLLPDTAEARIVTKTPPLTAAEVTEDDCEALRRSAERSCERLRRERLDALLVHHGSDLGLPGGGRLAEAVVGRATTESPPASASASTTARSSTSSASCFPLTSSSFRSMSWTSA